MGLLVSKSTLAALVTKYALSGMHIHIPAGPIDNDRTESGYATAWRSFGPFYFSFLARRPATVTGPAAGS